MEKKTKQKPKASKPEVVKLPDTVFIVQDIFGDYDGVVIRPFGFCYGKEEAEKVSEARQKEQEKKLAWYTLLSEKIRSELDSQKVSEIGEEIEKIDDIEGYCRTELIELKLLKK